MIKLFWWAAGTQALPGLLIQKVSSFAMVAIKHIYYSIDMMFSGWLQVDLLGMFVVSGIIVQGRYGYADMYIKWTR